MLAAIASTPVTAVAASGSRVEQRLEEAEDLIRQLQQEVDEMKKEQAAAPAPAPAKEDPNTFRAYWKDGLRFETKDKKYTARIGGRIQNDWMFGTMDEDLEAKTGEDLENGVEFRRARIYIEGTMPHNIFYKAQYDFAGGDPEFKDVYLGLAKIPWVGSFRVGQFKEPFSLEELTSSNNITFMERSLPNEVISPARHTGLMLNNAILEQRMTWAAGFFRNSDDFGDNSGDDEYVWTARLTGLPIYQDDGRTLLHLGAAGRTRQIGDEELRLRTRPEQHLAPRFADTGTFDAEHQTSAGAEAAFVYGPASLQSEYMYTSVDTPGTLDPDFDGFYVLASYFLTGEHRPYKTDEGIFGAVKPNHDFSIADGGWGAWEIATRYSQTDLDDQSIKGGNLRNNTVGLNWYLNPNVRVMLNYVHSHRQSEGSADMFGTRFQVFF
jgi:phosphate-selective porin OprO/OprP